MPIRLLLVDDDAGFRATLRQLLEQRAEAQVLGEAGNGEEAVRLTNDFRPDVVLMDLAMPRMNGLEATRQLKARWPDLAVIILTVHDDGVYRRTALAAGATAFLEKKMLGVDLWPTLARACRLGQELGHGIAAAGRRRRASQAREVS
jgi:DNA-binding NarL/FixJ family response regulator